MPNSSVKLESNAVKLSQGDVVIATSTGMAAKADDITITPASQKQAKFEVSEDDDSVTVAAQQGNVTVSDGQQSSTVPEGQQTTREKKIEKRGPPCPPAAGVSPGKLPAFYSRERREQRQSELLLPPAAAARNVYLHRETRTASETSKGPTTANEHPARTTLLNWIVGCVL